MASMNGWPEPRHAILTEPHRGMLDPEFWDVDTEGTVLTDAARWKRYGRIRKRLFWALYDLGLLMDNWDRLNLDKVFRDLNQSEYLNTIEGGEAAMYIVYRGFFEGGYSFKDALTSAINRAESQMNSRRVRVSFDVNPYEQGLNKGITSIADKVESGEIDDLRVSEMRALLEILAHSDLDVVELAKEGATAKHESDPFEGLVDE